MGLPALVLSHWPSERDLIVLSTAHKGITRDIRPIDQMDLGEQCLVGQPMMNRVHHGHVLIRCQGCFDMRDETWGLVVTRFG
jgi:hypothetical protein